MLSKKFSTINYACSDVAGKYLFGKNEQGGKINKLIENSENKVKDKELDINNRSRSAKLRTIERLR